MGFFSKLFGSDTVIQAGIDGIDAMVYTDEEKSTDKKAFLSLYEPYKLAQRYLALIIGIPYTSLCFLTGLMYLADIWFKRDMDFTGILTFLNGDFGSAFLLVLTFYFGGGAIEGVVNRFKKG